MISITVISLVWFTVGAATAGWFYHCGRTGASPMPQMPAMPWSRPAESNGEQQNSRPQPRVGI